MRTRLEQSVLEHIRVERMLLPGDRVGVAVSGGGDSVALLLVLERIHAELGITLAVLHFDHGLRGDESERDAQFVADLARSRGLEFFIERADVAAEARRNRWNLEDAARRLRYAFFSRAIEQGRATRIAIAHTADDQAETVLAHILRGTGTTGLAGIYPLAGQVVRPLLGTRREELRGYLTRLDQPWREDTTNQDPRRLRARVRAQLLSTLENDFSPRVVEHLCELARLCREEQVFWSALVDDRYAALVHENNDQLVISIADLLNPFAASRPTSGPTSDANPSPAPAPWQAVSERLIRRIYSTLRGDCRELTSDHVAQLLHLAGSSRSGRVLTLPGGILVERVFRELLFSRPASASASTPVREPGSASASARVAAGQFRKRGKSAGQVIAGYRYVLDVSRTAATTVSVPEIGACFRLEFVDWASRQRETTADTQILDADSIRAPLILRNWQPGDAYTPSGRREPRKLKRMFLAARVPSAARRNWPLLESAGRVIWVRGMPVAEGFSVTGRTRTGLAIEEDRL
jgi:tRNA(Ile)-lysidine synthase